MQRTLTEGPITRNILLFALPLMFGNLLQQMYNIADTWSWDGSSAQMPLRRSARPIRS